MVVFFSGTGNSRYCAKKIAARTGDELVDAAPLIRQGEKAVLRSARPWVFVAPVYAWRMARVFEDFLDAATLEGAEEAYFVLTCGGDIGGAGAHLEAFCREKGLRYMGTAEVVMPENYIAMFSAPDRAKSVRIMNAALPVLHEAARQISEKEVFPPRKGGLLNRLKSGKVNRGFYRYFVDARDFHATDACTSCGLCARRCVLNNITLEEGRPVWGEACTHCMACICGCPAGAIEYGKRTAGRRRYWCAEE